MGGEDVPRLLVGLGNPGARYAGTRHNVGADAVRALARLLGVTLRRSFLRRAWIGTHGRLTLAIPNAFMNVTGPVVARLARRAGPGAPLVVSDDLDLPLGTLRFRASGSAGGHNGLKSVIAALGTEDFPRLKIGIGRPPRKEDVVAWVLGRFTPEERDAAGRAVADAAAILKDVAERGLERAMAER